MLPEHILKTFNALLEEARTAGEPEPTAMTLSTVGGDGRVSSRVVLLKSVDERGFVFHTNANSLKGKQLADSPRVALNFLWKTLRDQVQVRIEGTTERVSDEESDAYFASRPRASQLGAWASLQSETLDTRETFERRLAECDAKFDGVPVPRPPHWGGYRVEPDRVEFWYGAPFRLHERQLHEYVDGAWTERLLYP